MEFIWLSLLYEGTSCLEREPNQLQSSCESPIRLCVHTNIRLFTTISLCHSNFSSNQNEEKETGTHRLPQLSAWLTRIDINGKKKTIHGQHVIEFLALITRQVPKFLWKFYFMRGQFLSFGASAEVTSAILFYYIEDVQMNYTFLIFLKSLSCCDCLPLKSNGMLSWCIEN